MSFLNYRHAARDFAMKFAQRTSPFLPFPSYSSEVLIGTGVGQLFFNPHQSPRSFNHAESYAKGFAAAGLLPPEKEYLEVKSFGASSSIVSLAVGFQSQLSVLGYFELVPVSCFPAYEFRVNLPHVFSGGADIYPGFRQDLATAIFTRLVGRFYLLRMSWDFSSAWRYALKNSRETLKCERVGCLGLGVLGLSPDPESPILCMHCGVHALGSEVIRHVIEEEDLESRPDVFRCFQWACEFFGVRISRQFTSSTFFLSHYAPLREGAEAEVLAWAQQDPFFRNKPDSVPPVSDRERQISQFCDFPFSR